MFLLKFFNKNSCILNSNFLDLSKTKKEMYSVYNNNNQNQQNQQNNQQALRVFVCCTPAFSRTR